MPIEDDDIYELNEDDAAEPVSSEVRPALSAEPVIEVLDSDGQTYALGDEVVPPPRLDTARFERPPHYCLGCSADLTVIDNGVCPECERPFNPEDDATFRDEPLDDAPNWWLEAPRLAGYVLLPLFLIGRWAVGGLAQMWGGEESNFVVGAGMVALTVPWAAACIFCLLIALQDHYNPKLSVTVPLGIGLGVFIALGAPALMVVVAAMCGPVAGFMWTWKSI